MLYICFMFLILLVQRGNVKVVWCNW